MLRRPDRYLALIDGEGEDTFSMLRDLMPSGDHDVDGPPFQGGVAGLLSYEFGDRVEALGLVRDAVWPDAAVAVYGALLAFDAQTHTSWAVARADDVQAARDRAHGVAGWLDRPAPPAVSGRLAGPLIAEETRARYEAAAADVVGRIGAGEIFQANIARTWTTRLRSGARPFDLFARLLVHSPAPHAAYLRLPGLAVVSNSPERFLSVDCGRVETRPIKGTRPRGDTPERDAALAAELLASAKDRAENLMIVDLMRNDLSRVCEPGTVRVEALTALESFVNVHHLVSTVSGILRNSAGYADLLRAAFPPGSVTGAPKVQAMRVIAGHEGPRGPYCGTLFRAGVDGTFESSVLIRTAAAVEDADGWRITVKAGAGIIADSDPVSEGREVEDKLAAIRRALTVAA